MEFPDLEKLDDIALMKEVVAENGDALAVLFDRYHNRVLSVGLRILKNREEAEEVMQQVFLEVWRVGAKFDPAKGKFYTWLMQYAYHRSLNRRQSLISRRFWSHCGFDIFAGMRAGSDDKVNRRFRDGTFEPPEELMLRPQGECNRLVEEVLKALNEEQRHAIRLVHYEGMSLKEAAEVANTPFHNMRHHYYRGLQKMKKHLSILAQKNKNLDTLGGKS
jgi:RNA polymerase sigma-70 factor (ECF subfamily)